MRTKLALAAVALAVLPWFLHDYGLQVAIQALVLGVFAMSFNLLFRNTGLLSFGHAACFGAAGYTTALLVSKLKWSFAATLPLALVAAALVALVIGFFSVRLTKIYFTMLTLAFAQMLWAVTHKWYSFTGGDNGITGLLPPGLLGNPRGLYFASLVALTVVCAIIHVVRRIHPARSAGQPGARRGHWDQRLRLHGRSVRALGHALRPGRIPAGGLAALGLP
jgi:branched-chain amino acid transport system permease protein